MAKILIIDDEENIRRSLKAALGRREHDIVTAATLDEGRRFSRAGFDLVFLDVMLPDGNGVDLLPELLAADPGTPVVMISGHADIDVAVQAIRSGAYDFLEKPLSLDRVMVLIDNATRTQSLQAQREQLSARLYGDVIGHSAAIQSVREQVARAAPRTSRFLITGENGTGKELVAHLVHRNSAFADGPFVAVNCAALPGELVESELFGHTPGAFTGASKRRKGRFLEALHGSIFLDEISEMPAEAQAKLLRVLENREFTPVGADKPEKFEGNVIAATNRDLAKEVQQGRFREDLLYRLNVVEIKIPPLRERNGDIAELASHFLTRFANETGGDTRTLTPEASQLIARYRFPGNVRELKNLMERVNIYADRPDVGPDLIRRLLPPLEEESQPALKEAVRQFELDYIKRAIARADDNIAQAARDLGLERSHLYKKLKQLEQDDSSS